MAMGKLTIMTDTMGVRGYVEDQRTGLIVPPDDPVALRQAMLWALDPADAGRMEEIRSAARSHVLSRLSPAKHVATILSIIDSVSANDRRSSRRP
ncbi:hypothetical protein BayCH28_26065 [Mycolicibacterium sp. CH28]|nr:hypothetical protein BayCH28_26065 [Mycolicibacterium sp. CH28]